MEKDMQYVETTVFKGHSKFKQQVTCLFEPDKVHYHNHHVKTYALPCKEGMRQARSAEVLR
uniref:Uncharacterized protein n=1 Tax=Arundo donax TaxID=35708 RepID=A0A0A9FDD6_ARUDO